jgi:hypothetical protein
LRALHYFGHGFADGSRFHSGSSHHYGQNIAIQHACHGHAVGAGLNSNSAADGLYQRLPVMSARAPDQRSIDVEKH